MRIITKLIVAVALIAILSSLVHAVSASEDWKSGQIRALEVQKAESQAKLSALKESENHFAGELTKVAKDLEVGASEGAVTPAEWMGVVRKHLKTEKLSEVEAAYKKMQSDKVALGTAESDMILLEKSIERLNSLTPAELNFEYQQKSVVAEAQVKYDSAERIYNINKKNSARKQARDDALKNLQTERSKLYALEKSARIAQYDREARDAQSERGRLVSQAMGLQERLEQELAKSTPDESEIRKYQSSLAKIDAQVAALGKAESQAKARVKYLQGETTFAQSLVEIVEAYSEFQGLGAFTSLFISDKDLQKRRDEANDLFCQSMLLGGSECWTSKLCEASADANIGGLSLIARTPQQDPRAAAHIEADVSLPISFINDTTRQSQTLRLYRVTYYLNNPRDVNMSYNLKFKQAGGVEYVAYGNGKSLAPGSSDSKLRVNAIIKYSDKQYTSVCLTFAPGIRRFGGGATSELCSPIVEYAGGPTSIQESGAASGQPAAQAATQQDFGGF
ncbi:hypothetical protein HY641_03500 [Candidatus Woesearchaeota archaeon]|nr:hypothetical protein [Candidatus Woesearchaeota archaeon]